MQRAERLRVGLAGAGMISRHHLIAWSRLESVQVVAVCDPDQGRAQARAAEFAIPEVYGTVEDLLNGTAIDAIDIATPRETHVDLVRLAAARGIDVLCQKPLAPDFGEAKALVADVGGSARLMVHENWRFRPYYRQAKAWLEAGLIGGVEAFRLAAISSGLLPDADGRRPALERQPFLAHERRLIIAELLIHHLDVARWLLGPLKVSGTDISHGDAPVVGETGADIRLVTETGAPVEVIGDWAASGQPARPGDVMAITGARGTLRLAGHRLELNGVERRSLTYDPAAAYQASFDAAIAHFVDCLRSGGAFETDGTDNLATLQLVDAAYAAAGVA